METIPIELILMMMIVVILGLSVLIPIMQDAISASTSSAMSALYQAIILFTVLADLILIIAWLKF